MLITIKNLEMQTFQLEIDPFATVLQLKQQIKLLKGKNYPAENQQLIYAGQFLIDDQTIGSYNIDEKKFIVVIVNRPKKVEFDQESSSCDNTASVSSTVQSDKKSNHGDRQCKRSIYDRMVTNIMELGYDRATVEHILQATSNNAHRAVEILFGIGNNFDDENEQRQDIFHFNPNIVSEESSESSSEDNNEQDSLDVSGNNSFVSEEEAVQMTQADRESIERLKDLGFPESLVLETYIACEKNENLTANVLLAHTSNE